MQNRLRKQVKINVILGNEMNVDMCEYLYRYRYMSKGMTVDQNSKVKS